ncbi:MAG: O-antigen ligase family protein [Minisyncoccota bacterium]
MQTNTFKNFLSWLVKGLLFVVPFVPLIPLYIRTESASALVNDITNWVSIWTGGGLFFPFIVGKAFIFRAIIEIVFALWLILVVFYKEFRPKKNTLLWAIAIFIGVTALATVLGVNPLRSFWSNFERMEGLVMYIHLFAYFLVLGNVFKKRDWFWFFNAFVASGLIEGVYALFQKMGKIPSPQGGFRVDGTIGNPAYLAAFLIFIVGFCTLLFLRSKDIYARTFYGFSGLFSLMIIYFTASRGPVLGILVALFLAGTIYLFFKKVETDSDKKIKKIMIGGLIGLVVLVGVLWGLKNTNFIKNSQTLSRLTNLSFSETTITSRLSIWQMSFKAFKEKPILGWGPENYIAVFSKYYSPEMWRQEPWFDRSHNVVFDWLINAGLIGLLSYLSIFFFAIKELKKNYQNKKISFEELILIVGIFIAYFFQNLFVFDNMATYISFFAILAWIYSISTEEEMRSLEKEKPAIDVNYFPIVIVLVFLVMFFYAYQINIKPYQENNYLINGLAASSQNDSSTAFDYFQKAFNVGTFLGRDEVFGQYITFSLSALRDQNLSNDKKQQIAQLGVKELEVSKNGNPLDPRPLMYSSLLLQSIGETDRAIENMELARKLSPKKQDILSNLARLYLGKQEYDKALPILLENFNEDKTYPEARIDLVGGYIVMGEQEKADQLLVEGFGKLDVPYNFLITAYNVAKKYDRVLGIWKAFVEESPTNTNYLKSLAGAYLLNGQRDNAIEALRSISNINPDLEKEMDGYIYQIQSGQM